MTKETMKQKKRKDEQRDERTTKTTRQEPDINSQQPEDEINDQWQKVAAKSNHKRTKENEIEKSGEQNVEVRTRAIQGRKTNNEQQTGRKNYERDNETQVSPSKADKHSEKQPSNKKESSRNAASSKAKVGTKTNQTAINNRFSPLQDQESSRPTSTIQEERQEEPPAQTKVNRTAVAKTTTLATRSMPPRIAHSQQSNQSIPQNEYEEESCDDNSINSDKGSATTKLRRNRQKAGPKKPCPDCGKEYSTKKNGKVYDHKCSKTPTTQERHEENEQEDEDICRTCQEGGFLMQCEQCLQWIHPECETPAMSTQSIPEGSYTCSRCAQEDEEEDGRHTTPHAEKEGPQGCYGTCPICKEHQMVCQNGQMRQHQPCGKPQASAEDSYRVAQWYGAKRKSKPRRRGKQGKHSISKRTWAEKVANLIRKIAMDPEAMDMERKPQEEQMNNEHQFNPNAPQYKTNSALSKYVIQLIKMTPPDGRTSLDQTTLGEEEREHVLPNRHQEMGMDQTRVNAMMQMINKALFKDGRLQKARRLLNSNGVASVSDPKVRKMIEEKFPPEQRAAPEEQEDSPAWFAEAAILGETIMTQQNGYEGADTWDPLQVMALVDKKKTGSGQSATGWSFDHMKDLFYYEPTVIEPLTEILQRIPWGVLDEEAKSLLFFGRGTALWKNKDQTDLRPIGCLHPLLSIVGNMVNGKAEEMIESIVGIKQLGGRVHGSAEIAPHLLRAILQQQPDWVVLHRDAINAWGKVHKWAMLAATALSMGGSAFQSYAQWELSGAAPRLAFDDPNTGTTQVVEVVEGCVQGGNISGSAFNIAQAMVTRTVYKIQIEKIREDEEEDIIALYDDNYIYGTPRMTMLRAKLMEEAMKEIGVTYHTEKKRQMYGYGEWEQYAENDKQMAREMGIEWIRSEEGIKVSGAPVGSDAFEQKMCMQTVKKIEQQIIRLKSLVSSQQTTVTKCLRQWVFAVIRLCMPSQLNHLLRAVPPSNTRKAAQRLDKIITDFVQWLVHIEADETTSPTQKQIAKIIIQPISRGGMGIAGSEAAAPAAYVGSWALVAQKIGMLRPELKTEHEEIMNGDPKWLKELKEIMMKPEFSEPLKKMEITITSIWEMSYPRVQKELTTAIQAIEAPKATAAMMPTLRPVAGPAAAHQERYIQEGHRVDIGQLNANEDSMASAWLTANPTTPNHGMTDSAFIISCMVRLMQDVISNDPQAPRICAACGQIVDKQGAHLRKCRELAAQGGRQKLRNTWHKALQHIMIKFLTDARHIINAEVHNLQAEISRYYGLHPEADPTQIKFYADAILFHQDAEKTTTLIDFTVAEPSKISTQSICLQPGQAADASERQKWYKWNQSGINFEDNPNNTRLLVLAFDSSGALGKSARNFMEDIAKVEKANGGTSYNEQQRRKQLSVQLQTLRAQCIVESRGVTYSITQTTSNTEQVPSSPSTNPDSHAGPQTPSSILSNSNPRTARDERNESDEDEDSSPESPPSQLKLANEPYYEEYPTPHSTQSQHDPGDANEAESQNGRPDNPQTSVSTD